MAEYKLELSKREQTGKKIKSLRSTGLIPSVIYGVKEPILTASEYVPTEKILQKAGYHSPIDLMIDGKKKMAIVKSVSIDPVSRKIMNVEFQAISAKEAVTASTPVTIVNFEESEAHKTHQLAYNQAIEELEIKAKPADLPQGLTVDASKLASVEDKLKISDIILPPNVEYADKELDQEQVVASLYDPAAEAEKRAAAEAAAAEAAAAEVEAAEAAETEESGEAAEASESTDAAESSDDTAESAEA